MAGGGSGYGGASVEKMQAGFAQISNILSGGILRGVEKIGGAWGKVIAELAGAIGRVQSQVGVFVGAFNPAYVQAFERAVKDLYGSIGENLVPVLDAFRHMVRWVGDTVAGMTPVVRPAIEQVIQAAKPIFEAMGGGIRQTVQALAPFLQLLGQTASELLTAVAPAYEAYYDLLGEVGELIAVTLVAGLEAVQPLLPLVAAGAKEVAGGIRLMAEWVRWLTDEIRHLLGLSARGIDFDGKGVNKGAASVSFGSTDEMWRNVVRSTMMAGVGEKKADPVPGIADDVKEIRKKIENFLQGLEQKKEQVKEFAGDAGMFALSPLAGLASTMRRMLVQSELRGG